MFEAFGLDGLLKRINAAGNRQLDSRHIFTLPTHCKFLLPRTQEQWISSASSNRLLQ